MQRIAQLRKEKHLNQVGLALLLNVSQKMISAYESGTHQPSIETLTKISKIFGVSVDYIIENSNIRASAEQMSTQGLTTEQANVLAELKKLDKDSCLKVMGYIQGLQSK